MTFWVYGKGSIINSSHSRGCPYLLGVTAQCKGQTEMDRKQAVKRPIQKNTPDFMPNMRLISILHTIPNDTPPNELLSKLPPTLNIVPIMTLATTPPIKPTATPNSMSNDNNIQQLNHHANYEYHQPSHPTIPAIIPAFRLNVPR